LPEFGFFEAEQLEEKRDYDFRDIDARIQHITESQCAVASLFAEKLSIKLCAYSVSNVITRATRLL